jgi:NADPH:quinone reductase-like Zn-dependent oxidoreductase
MRQTRIGVRRYGGPDVLTAIEEDIPTPKAGEVRVKLLAAGVGLPDILAREGIHPETPRVPYTPGWDLLGTVDRLGAGVTGIEPGQKVAAMPIHGCYAHYVCLLHRKLVPVPPESDAAEAVAVVLNHIPAYQMLHRSVQAEPGQKMLIHAASGGVGSAMLQLAKLAGIEMYGTCPAQGATVVRELGGIPIDYKTQDFVKEIRRLTVDGVDAVFDAIGGDNLWRSRDALRRGGRVVIYGFPSRMRGRRMASARGGRHRVRESARLGCYIVRNWFQPGRKSMAPYSIQWWMRFRPEWFRHDLLALLDLLQRGMIKPLIAQRLPLEAARRAHEMLGEGGVLGKIVLLPNG